LSIPLGSYFTDDDGDTLTLSASYSFNSGTSVSIPGGIFSFSSSDTIDVISTGQADVGTYTISLALSDGLAVLSSSFTLTITNVAPRLVTPLIDMTAPQNVVTTIDLTTYFTDDDGDAVSVSSITYSYNGGAAVSIPGGIFSYPSSLVIEVLPTSPACVGSYQISITVSDTVLT
jgi:hypothetical protein